LVTVSHLVKKYISEQPFVEEALGNGIISYGNLAEQMAPRVEKELGKKIKHAAVVMALRRYSDELSSHKRGLKKFDYSSELLMKTNIADFTVIKSPSLMTKLKTIQTLVNHERGDILNVIVGNNEVSIVVNEKYLDPMKKFLSGEKIVNTEKGLVSLAIIFTADDFLHTPGVIFNAVRTLAWNNINIYEIVSTMTELTFIINKKDSMKAYEVLSEMTKN
jgi:aspartokinase